MAQLKANIDECIFRLRENIKQSRLTEAERGELNRSLQVLETITKDWRTLKQEQASEPSRDTDGNSTSGVIPEPKHPDQ